MLKSERGMSRLELVIAVVSIMFILACTVVLLIGENGLSFLPKGDKGTNTANEANNTNIVNEIEEKNEILPAENKITNEIQNIIDDTVNQ